MVIPALEQMNAEGTSLCRYNLVPRAYSAFKMAADPGTHR